MDDGSSRRSCRIKENRSAFVIPLVIIKSVIYIYRSTSTSVNHNPLKWKVCENSFLMLVYIRSKNTKFFQSFRLYHTYFLFTLLYHMFFHNVVRLHKFKIQIHILHLTTLHKTSCFLSILCYS